MLQDGGGVAGNVWHSQVHRQLPVASTYFSLASSAILDLPCLVAQAHFVPHPEVSRVAAECKLDAQGMVEGALRCRCHKPLRVSHGPLKGVTAADKLLQAPETAYQDTEAAYVFALVSSHGQPEHMFPSLVVVGSQPMKNPFT